MARGGARKGTGPKKGSHTKKTLERKMVEERLRQRFFAIADKVFDKQLGLINGSQYLYKIEKEMVGSGKNARIIKKKPVLVESQLELEQYLSGLIEEGDMDDPKDPLATYYFLTTKDPEKFTIKDIQDRYFGSPVQSTKLVDDQGNALQPITHITYTSLPDDTSPRKK